MQAKLMVIVLAAVVAVVAAGCGSSSSTEMSKADYEAKIQANGKAVQDAVAAISAGFTNIKSVAKQVAAAEVAAKKAVDDLDATNPPKDVAADNDALVVALRAIDAQLKKLSQAAKAGDAMAAVAAASALQSSPEIRAGQAAIKDMQKKGYAVGVLGNDG
jgi:ABC-type Fe3+-citrate transport system substrate-binding protein